MRRQPFILIWYAFICIAMLSGCTSTPPGSAVIDGNGTLLLDLPPDVSKLANVPPNLRATIAIHAKSEAISTTPLRSKYEGTIQIHIADPSGKVTFVNFNSTIRGERDGEPNDALREYFNRLLDEVGTLSKSLPSTTLPNSR